MAIRIRTVQNKVIALCAAKTEPEPGDLYLDDNVHHALTNKFGLDFQKEGLLKGIYNSDMDLELLMNLIEEY